jgi:hypothetical protein
MLVHAAVPMCGLGAQLYGVWALSCAVLNLLMSSRVDMLCEGLELQGIDSFWSCAFGFGGLGCGC